MRRWAVSAVVTILLATGLAAGAGTGPAGAAAQWIDGSFATSSVINCPSMIFGSPYPETGIMSYVGYRGDPTSATPDPAVGQTFPVHVVLGAPGYTCSGQYAGTTLVLPAGLQVVGAPTCAYTAGPSVGGQACTAVPAGQGRYYFRADPDGVTMWPLPHGAILEFTVNVKATQQVSDRVRAEIGVADGNSSPTLAPSVPVYVMPGGNSTPSQTSITYASPSTLRTPGNPPAHESRGYVVAPARGTVAFEIGYQAGNYPGSSTAVVEAGSWYERAQWTYSPAMAGVTYHWRLCFTPDGGSKTCGPDQTFTGLAADSTAPHLDGIEVINSHAGTVGDPVRSPTITMKLTFSEPVTGVEDALFESNGGMTVKPGDKTVVSPISGEAPIYAKTYTVTMPAGLGIGTRGLGVLAGGPVTDAAGNTLANGDSRSVHVNRPTPDVTPPTITPGDLPVVSLGSSFTLHWTASDAGSGLGFFTVRSRSIAPNGTAGGWSKPGRILARDARSASTSLAGGTTRCVRVTATDVSNNSATGADRCTTSPVDDRNTKAGGAWSPVASAAAYRGTLSRSSSVGATRSLTGVTAKRVMLVAEKRPGAGTVEVRVNNVVRATYPLASSVVHPRQIMTVTLPTVISNARVEVRVKSAGHDGVRIDGLGVRGF
ncbi:MAG: hypothetical protein U0R64_06635 [Candidatus Nanopelagicales bacterium]